MKRWTKPWWRTAFLDQNRHPKEPDLFSIRTTATALEGCCASSAVFHGGQRSLPDLEEAAAKGCNYDSKIAVIQINDTILPTMVILSPDQSDPEHGLKCGDPGAVRRNRSHHL